MFINTKNTYQLPSAKSTRKFWNIPVLGHSMRNMEIKSGTYLIRGGT